MKIFWGILVFIIGTIWQTCGGGLWRISMAGSSSKFVSTSSLSKIGRSPAQKALNQSQYALAGIQKFSMENFGLIQIQPKPKRLFIHMRYADTTNFLHQPVYPNSCGCFVHPYALKLLDKALDIFEKEYPDLGLLIWDCARPLSVQKQLWEKAEIPRTEKWKYLSHPERGSVHNFGLALDLTLADTSGRPLDMGTDFDHFGPEAQPVMEDILWKNGVLSEHVLNNRRLLRRIMRRAGFFPIPHEWWHFNAMSRRTASEKFSLIP